MDFRFREFMRGRNGMDKFNSLLLTLSIFFALLSVIMEIFFQGRGNLWVLAAVCLAFGLFRFLSRNVGRRQLENQSFLQLWSRVEVWWSRIWIRLRTKRQFVVLTCPGCRLKQRVPRGKGRVRVHCKRCSKTFEAHT